MTVNIQQVDLGGGPLSALDINSATVVKTGAGRCVRVVIRVVSAAAGAVYDSASTTGNTSANQILAIPANKVAATVYDINFPVFNGIVVAPGASGSLGISYM